jgi:polysaccharide deacetylase 2 family uncharacterized protein YibQ
VRKEAGYKIAICVLALIIIAQWVFIITIRPKKAPPKIPIAVKVKAKIAIVIDDWGYNLNNLHILDRIKYPLTHSVLPNLSYSARVANELHRRGFQIILHLPMEPHEKYRLEKNTIMTTMDEPAIKNIVEQDLNSIVYAKGVSNHMGSAATEDGRTMGIVFKELKKRRLYFLDSFVSSKSVCSELAAKIGLGFAERDVFLDNKEEPGYIRQQLYKLKLKAKMYGKAIGIGHDRKITLEVLEETMPELEKEGYKFVFASELVK